MIDAKLNPPWQNAILITGAGQRIGYRLAKHFLQEGQYPVVFSYRTAREQVNELEALGAFGIQVDFCCQASTQSFIKTVQTQVGSLRALVHNASIWLPDSELSAAGFQALMDVHVRTPYLLNRAFTDLLRASTSKYKDIIAITDSALARSSSDHIVYLASKAALASMTKNFARKLAPQVKVNEIQPGLIIFNEQDSEDYKQKRLAQSALQIEPGVEVVIEAVDYLMSSRYTTGTQLVLDGGRNVMS